MKKIRLTILLSLALALLLSIGVHGASNPIGIAINGTPVTFTQDTGMPFLDKNGRTQVPLKVVLNAMNVEVTWDGTKREVTVDGYRKVRIPIGQKYLYVGVGEGEKTAIDTAAVIVGGKTYIPIAAVLTYSQRSCNVTWDNATRTVVIAQQGLTPNTTAHIPAEKITYLEWYDENALGNDKITLDKSQLDKKSILWKKMVKANLITL